MIRPVTLVCALLAGGSGLYLYQTKHTSQLLDREIVQTIKQTDQVRERIGVLKVEWSQLSEPDRLNDLNQQHLGLRALATTQFAAFDQLAGRLPAPLAPGTAPPQPSFATDEAAAPEPAAAAAPIASAPPPVPKPATKPALPAPALVAAADPRPAPPRPSPALRPTAETAPPRLPLAPVLSAAATPIGPHNAATAPGTVGEAVLRAMQARAQAYAAAGPIAPAVSVPASLAVAAAPASPMMSGSVLGAGRSALPPPVPYAGR